MTIVESPKSKIASLAGLGEKIAEIASKKIEAEEAAGKSVDRIILEEAKKCNLIDELESEKLLFLWRERCKFAHPYQIAPNLDELKYIISQAVEITLSKPILFKKNFIDELIVDLAEKIHFLPNSKNNIDLHAQRTITRIAPNLNFYLFKCLAAKFGELLEDETKRQFAFRFRIYIVRLLHTYRNNLDNEKWGMESMAVKFPLTVVGFMHPLIWSSIP